MGKVWERGLYTFKCLYKLMLTAVTIVLYFSFPFMHLYTLCTCVCCFALFVCLTLLASSFLPSHLSNVHSCTLLYQLMTQANIGKIRNACPTWLSTLMLSHHWLPMYAHIILLSILEFKKFILCTIMINYNFLHNGIINYVLYNEEVILNTW